MERLTWNEILDSVKSVGDINFIAEAMTPLHALGIETFLVHLKSLGIKTRGYILAVPHPETGWALDDASFHKDCYEGISVVAIDSNSLNQRTKISYYLRLRHNQNESNSFYYVTPYMPSFARIPQVMAIRPKANLNVVVTDEGTASYVSSPFDLGKTKRAGMNLKDCVMFMFRSAIRDRFLEYRLKRTGKIARFLMYETREGKLFPNGDYVTCANQLLASETIDEDYSDYEDAVVFVPGLMYEAGLISRRCDVEIYRQIIDILGNEEKYVVKPHPREKNTDVYECLECKVEKNHRYSSEKIIANLRKKPKYVIGDSSTSLANISSLFGVKSIAINKLIDRDSLYDKSYFDVFNNTYDGIVFIPNNWNELITFMKNGKNVVYGKQ